MHKDVRNIRISDLLSWGRWMMAIIILLLALQARAGLESWFSIAEFSFAGGAVAATYTRLIRGRSPGAKWTIWVTIIDLLAITGLFLSTWSLSMWFLYSWCVIESALSLRSKFGFLTTVGIDVLTVIFILTWMPREYTVTQWLAALLLFNVQSLPLVFVTFWETKRKKEIENQLENFTAQNARVKELENIARQMTDYTMDVQNRAVIDQLTGLYNQTYFHHRLVIEVEKARQSGGSISLMLCDIDHFKTFNDRFGHYLGDDVLRSVAKVLLEAVEGTFWIAGRIGGEEMCIAMPDVPINEAKSFAESVRQAIAKMNVNGPTGPLRVTISAGVAGFPHAATDAMELTKHADQAMYHAKDTGRNQIYSYLDMLNSIV